MDFTESEQIEVDALRKRYNHLALIAADNDCGYDTKSIPAFDKKPKPKVDEDEGDSDLGV